jgi:glycosyltransferase involved in cell wall biosynthesis
LDSKDGNNALRVLFVGDFPTDFERPKGGVESVAHNLACGLVRAGVDLTVIRFGAVGDKRSKTPDFEIIDVPRRRPGSLGNWLVSPHEVKRVVDRVKPDIVHLQGASELYRGASPPSVLTIHGIPYRDATHGEGFARRRLQPLLLRLSFEESIRKHRDVIVINPIVRGELGERQRIRFHDIPNPVEDAFFEVVRSPVEARVLYVGVLSRLKNIVGLIESAARARESVPHLRLRLCGPFVDSAEGEIRDAIDRFEMQDAVEFMGSLSKAEVRNELGRCACLALASLQETAPMAIAEAMAAGVPVVASRVGGVEWMIEQGVTGLMSPAGDTGAFARNLVELLSDRSRQRQIGDAARRVAETEYGLDRVVERTCEVYRQAIAVR